MEIAFFGSVRFCTMRISNDKRGNEIGALYHSVSVYFKCLLLSPAFSKRGGGATPPTVPF